MGWDCCVIILNRVVRIGLIEKMTFVRRLEIVEEVGPVDVYGGQ